MKLREIKQSISALPPREMRKLAAWLRVLLSNGGSKKRGRSTKRDKVPRASRATHKTYQQEMVRCGKKGCRCTKGELHGPYWYAYWSEGGKTRSEYVGKHLPKTREKHRRNGV